MGQTIKEWEDAQPKPGIVWTVRWWLADKLIEVVRWLNGGASGY